MLWITIIIQYAKWFINTLIYKCETAGFKTFKPYPPRPFLDIF